MKRFFGDYELDNNSMEFADNKDNKNWYFLKKLRQDLENLLRFRMF